MISLSILGSNFIHGISNMFVLILLKKSLLNLIYNLFANSFNLISFLLVLAIFLILIIALFLFIRLNRKLRESQITLKENEERFRQLADLTFEGILIHENGKMIDGNKSFLEMFGYSREELLGKNVINNLIHKEDREITEQNVDNKEIRPYQVRGIKKNGELLHAEIESRNIMFEGRHVRVTAVRDISERKKQEAILAKEQWFFTTLMNSVTDAIYFKNLDSKFIRVNPQALKIFNVARAEEIIGKSDFDFFEKDHAQPAFDDEQQIIKTRKPLIGKVEKETWKDGRVSWVSTTKLPLINKEGKVVGTFGLSRDITDLKAAQEKVLEEKEKFELLFRLVPSAVFTVDTDGKITSWNNMAEEITGYKAEEIINKDCRVCGKKIEADFCGMFDENISKPIINDECTLKRKDGTLITVSKNVDYIKDNTGNIIGGVESFVDISDHKRHEAEIQKYSDELSELNKSKDRFFSIIAHDLRNPFVTLLGFTEMLIEDYDEFSDEEKIGFLSEILKTSKNSYELLENLLQWSRAQTGRIKYEPVNLDFNELLKSNFELVEKNAELKKINLKSEIDSQVLLHADEDMLTTVMRNLITNALKFTESGGEITVGAHDADENMKEIYVRDTGIGISKDRLSGIFKIDETSSTEGTNGEKGSGLGVILSKEFIEKNCGKIWVESIEGLGTTFHFTIPKAK